MLRLLPALLVLILSLALVACGGDDEDEGADAGQTETAPATVPATTDAEECRTISEPEPKGEQSLRRPSTRLERDKVYEAVVTTNCGQFTITLDPRRAPRTGGSFLELANRDFYDNTTFHRIVSGFVVQGGDPQGTGQGGPGYSVVERPPRDLTYGKGTVAMAKTEIEDPGTSGSQFFIVIADDAGLPPDYALLGRVTDGLDVVERIGVLPTDQTEQPIDPVVMQSVEVNVRDADEQEDDEEPTRTNGDEDDDDEPARTGEDGDRERREPGRTGTNGDGG
jgi:peptidyl-prolyl cis-trans isomerase B (cyclophilin B)